MSDTFKSLWEEALGVEDFPLCSAYDSDCMLCFFCGAEGSPLNDRLINELDLHKPNCLYVRLKKLLAESAE